MGRFLRSKHLRNALWLAAGGRCQICGCELPNDWHADHIEPWHISGRTNIHEMQALCPACNLKKGASVSDLFLPDRFSCEWEKMRPGQPPAINMIADRVRAGEPYTCVVLPTRYGKSDVIRVASILLWYEGITGAALVLSPNKILRNQMTSPKKFNPMLERYGIKIPGLKINTLKSNPVGFTKNGEMFVSATIQLVNENIGAFEQWVEQQIQTTGLPPVVFVDEAHTGSEENTFGEAVKRLVAAGARAVLLTATPIRSDGLVIPGFDCRVLDSEATKVWIPNRKKDAPEGKIWVDVLEGVKHRVELVAHYEVTFRDAWDEKPSPLCKITRVPFDVRLERILPDETEVPELLSELSPSAVRKALGRIVRHPDVIRAGVEKLVTELRAFRNVCHNCQAIIFCGNDRGDDKISNEHAKDIRAVVEEYASDLTVVIATSTAGNDSCEKVEGFANGEGDVLIVKQMAGIGLDDPPLKVGLDLSSVRTHGSVIQRLMRVATIYGFVKHCVWITPDDCMSRAIFEAVVKSQGGEATTADLTLKASYLKDKEELERAVVSVTGTAQANFHDTNSNESDAERYGLVRTILSQFPELTALLSHNEIDKRAAAWDVTVKPKQAYVTDTDAVRDDLIDQVNEVVKKITMRRIKSFSEYADAVRQVYNDAKEAAGVDRETSIDKKTGIKDEATLRRILRGAERLAAKEGVEC